jgi:hypothetical protein
VYASMTTRTRNLCQRAASARDSRYAPEQSRSSRRGWAPRGLTARTIHHAAAVDLAKVAWPGPLSLPRSQYDAPQLLSSASLPPIEDRIWSGNIAAIQVGQS